MRIRSKKKVRKLLDEQLAVIKKGFHKNSNGFKSNIEFPHNNNKMPFSTPIKWAKETPLVAEDSILHKSDENRLSAGA